MGVKIPSLKITAINVSSIIENIRRLNLKNLLENNDPVILLLSKTKLNSSHKIQFTDTQSSEMTDRMQNKAVEKPSLLKKILNTKYCTWKANGQNQP